MTIASPKRLPLVFAHFWGPCGFVGARGDVILTTFPASAIPAKLILQYVITEEIKLLFLNF